MFENTRCKRWLTTNQDEFQNPFYKKVQNYIQSEEIGRYEDCMINKDCGEQAEKVAAREVICCAEQNANREPTSFPTDSHIDPELRACKPPWCRCLATGDPSLYEENREEAKTDDMCYCKMCYKQLETPSVDNPRAKIYSSTHFIDFRDPAYPFIQNKMALQKVLENNFKAYKAKADAEDAKKERKLAPLPPEEQDPVEPNCIGNYPNLPPAKIQKGWKEDQSWFREESSDCVKNLLKKYVWTTTYREMNKDGAALPLVVRETPTSCLEKPPGDPVRAKPELAPCTIVHLGDVFEKWDRPQVRRMARRCDTITNNPFLDSCCLDKDSYFQEQYLDRTKFAECPTKAHDVPSEENMRLARENKLRQCYDRMIPYYAGYDPIEAPPVCKIKKVFNPFDPYDMLSVYQADFANHPTENYAHPVEPYKPAVLEKTGIATNPINALSKRPLPDATRLSCYLECKQVPCQRCPDGSMSSYIECQKLPCKPPPRNFGLPPPPSEFEPQKTVQVVIPAQLKTEDSNATYLMDVPKQYQECNVKPKEDLMQIGTYVLNQDNMKVTAKSGNLMLGKKKEYRGCGS